MEASDGFEQVLRQYLENATLEEQHQLQTVIDEAISAVDDLFLHAAQEGLTSGLGSPLLIYDASVNDAVESRLKIVVPASQPQSDSASAAVDAQEAAQGATCHRLGTEGNISSISHHQSPSALVGGSADINPHAINAWAYSSSKTSLEWPSHPMTAIQIALINGQASGSEDVRMAEDSRHDESGDGLKPTQYKPQTVMEESIRSPVGPPLIPDSRRQPRAPSPLHLRLSPATSSLGAAQDDPSSMSVPSTGRLVKRNESVESMADSSLWEAGTPVASRSPSLSPSATWTAKIQPSKSWNKVDKEGNVMLGVRLIQADLSQMGGASKRSWDPYVAVKCEKTCKISKAVTNSAKPQWDEFFAFELVAPAFAVLKVKVMDHMHCWKPQLLGEVRISVNRISERPQSYNMPSWLPLKNRQGKPKGQVQVQIYYVCERVHRPLDIMCCTWNVGNAQPPDDLSQWLSGVVEQEHDLVAIGVQECTYKQQRPGADDFAMSGYMDGSIAGTPVAKPYYPIGTEVDPPEPHLGRYSSEWLSPQGAAGSQTSPIGADGMSPRKGDASVRRASARTSALGAIKNLQSMITRNGSGSSSAVVGGALQPAGEMKAARSEKTSGPTTPRDSRSVSPSGSHSSLPILSARLSYQPKPTAVRAHRRASVVESELSGSSQLKRRYSAAAKNRTSSMVHLPSGPHPSLMLNSSQGLVRENVSDSGQGSTSIRQSLSLSDLQFPSKQQTKAGPESESRSRPGQRPGRAVNIDEETKPLHFTTNTRRLSRLSRESCSESMVFGGDDHCAPSPSSIQNDAHSDLQHPWSRAADVPPPGRPLGEAHEDFDNGPFASPTALNLRGMDPSVAVRSQSPAAAAASSSRKMRGVTDLATGGQFRDVWEDHIKDSMGPNYAMVKSAHMGQIRLLLFARNDVCAAVNRVEKGSQATGVAGVATNKGGVAIGIRVWDTEICFINAHMAAHQDRTKARNGNYRDIVRGIRIDPHNMDCLTGYHHVFWFGDLNYRLDWGSQASNPTESPSQADFDEIVSKVDDGKYDELLKTDQLHKEMAASRVFLGFTEASIDFPPTFKVERVDGIEYKMQRSPAWCDRVLYRANVPSKKAEAIDYFCAPNVSSSDHKPVSAVFSVPTIWRRHDANAEVPTANVVIVVSKISIDGLFVLRKKSGSDFTSALPNAYVTLMGFSLLDGEYRTPVVRQSRDPVWDEPAEILMKPALAQDIANYRLMVRVVNRQEGFLPGGGAQHTLGRCALPLTEAALLVMKGSSECATVKLQLEYNGLPAGLLTLTMRLKMPDKPTPKLAMRSFSAMGRLVRNSMAFGNKPVGDGLPRKPSTDAGGSGEGRLAAMGRLIRKSIASRPPSSGEPAGFVNRGTSLAMLEGGSVTGRSRQGGEERDCSGDSRRSRQPSGSANNDEKLAGMRKLLRVSINAGISLGNRVSFDNPMMITDSDIEKTATGVTDADNLNLSTDEEAGFEVHPRSSSLIKPIVPVAGSRGIQRTQSAQPVRQTSRFSKT